MDTQKILYNSIKELCEHLEALNLEFVPLVESELQVQAELAERRGHGQKRTQRLFVRETFSSQVSSLINFGKDIIASANTLLDAFKDTDAVTIEEYVYVLSESRLRYQASGIATYDMLNLIQRNRNPQ